MEEEEGHHRKATQINSVAGTGKGRGRPGRRIGLAPKVPSYWETRRGEEEAGVAVGMKSCYAHGMARNN